VAPWVSDGADVAQHPMRPAKGRRTRAKSPPGALLWSPATQKPSGRDGCW